MLHINNACIAFGTEVLFSGLNLNLERGETACIVGQSGCGKTSLLNAVMGFVPLKEGTIKVGDTLLDKSTIDIIRRQIAWIPQELALPFEWVKEMVALPFDLKIKIRKNLEMICYICNHFRSSFGFFEIIFYAFFNACSMSAMMSSTFSIPTERRIIPGDTPASASCSSFIWR